MSDPDVPGRLENLAGAWALRIATTVDDALAARTRLGPADRAALVSLLNYADGERADVLRRGLRLSQPGAAHAVERLARLGLVQRRRSARDGRETLLHLTPEGEREARALRAARLAAVDEALTPLGTRERATLERLLDRLLGAPVDVDTARHTCRLCDADVCGHPARCPVTRAARPS